MRRKPVMFRQVKLKTLFLIATGTKLESLNGLTNLRFSNKYNNNFLEKLLSSQNLTLQQATLCSFNGGLQGVTRSLNVAKRPTPWLIHAGSFLLRMWLGEQASRSLTIGFDHCLNCPALYWVVKSVLINTTNIRLKYSDINRSSHPPRNILNCAVPRGVRASV